MPKTMTFPFPKTKSTLDIVEDPLNKTNRRKKMQMAPDRIGLGFWATSSTISAGPSGGRSTSAQSTSGMTIAQGLRIGGGVNGETTKSLKWLKERTRGGVKESEKNIEKKICGH
jgi:hypothetical protein